MRIAGRTIQPKNISIDTNKEFEATYKNHEISISAFHGHRKPKYDHLIRFNIDVRHKDGTYAVQTYEDFHGIRDAIIFALEGALL